jgi:hypothetical protein
VHGSALRGPTVTPEKKAKVWLSVVVVLFVFLLAHMAKIESKNGNSITGQIYKRSNPLPQLAQAVGQ